MSEDEKIIEQISEKIAAKLFKKFTEYERQRKPYVETYTKTRHFINGNEVTRNEKD